jgi:hypothetical protein
MQTVPQGTQYNFQDAKNSALHMETKQPGAQTNIIKMLPSVSKNSIRIKVQNVNEILLW